MNIFDLKIQFHILYPQPYFLYILDILRDSYDFLSDFIRLLPWLLGPIPSTQ